MKKLTVLYEVLFNVWTLAGGLIALLISGAVTVHILLTKEDERAAGWLGLVWLVPFLGSLCYYIFGMGL